MKNKICIMPIFMALCALFSPKSTYGQEQDSSGVNMYLSHRVFALEKSIDRINSLQQRLLKRLQREENKMLRKLAKQDSSLYKEYIRDHSNFDSIAIISNDTLRQKNAIGSSLIIDSLKGIQRFIQNQEVKLYGSTEGRDFSVISLRNDQLNTLQQKLNTQVTIDQLIQQHTNDLKQLAGKANISGLQNIQKDVYYAREKIKVYKEMADDPDETEMKAMEYLQGSENFNKYLYSKTANGFGRLGSDATAEDLQRMGYQTKSQVSNALKEKLGKSLGSVQQQMGQQIEQYSKQLIDLKQNVNELKVKVNETKQTLSDVENVKSNVKNIEAPNFKTNKEKGKPFSQRIEVQYNFQSSRANVDGSKPAIFTLGINIGYKQTEHLSFGVGFALNSGLGQNWQHLKFSYEGISFRAYADWLWIYNFSFQAGYERTFVPDNRPYLISNSNANNNNTSSENALQQAFGGQQQATYIGIMKRYKISSNWRGTFLIGYNVLWNQEGAKTPWLLRLGWCK